MRRWNRWLLLWVLGMGLALPLAAEEKKYQLCVCALFKNEAAYLREWLEYHRMLGVDHFYLYDNGSSDHSIKVLRPYVKEGIVTLVRWQDRIPEDQTSLWALSTQLPAYESALKYRAVKESRWLVFLDVNEFLVPVQANTLLDVLAAYEECSGIELRSESFDAAEVSLFPQRELLISTTALAPQEKRNLEKSIDKMIFKPEQQVAFTWPPYRCVFTGGVAAQPVDRAVLRINRYVNRHTGSWQWGKKKDKISIDLKLLTESDRCALLEAGFALDDPELVIARFVPDLRKRIGLDTGWIW